jgi:hypothetical protein
VLEVTEVDDEENEGLERELQKHKSAIRGFTKEEERRGQREIERAYLRLFKLEVISSFRKLISHSLHTRTFSVNVFNSIVLGEQSAQTTPPH